MTLPALSILALSLLAANARAGEPGERDEAVEPAPDLKLAPPWGLPPREVTTSSLEGRSWYGYQLILSDLISLSVGVTATFAALVSCPFLVFGGSAQPSSGCIAARGVVLASAGTFLVMPAIIHLAHGRPGAAGGSLALRIALPIAAGLFTGFPPACLLGLLVGVVIDDAFLSSEPSPPLDRPPGER